MLKAEQISVEVVERRDDPGVWSVEAINTDGSIEMALFPGPNSKDRATEYAAWRYKLAEAADTITALRAEVERLRADLRLAVMSDSNECKALSQEVERLVKSRNRWGRKYNVLLEKHKRLRAALQAWDDAVVVNLVMEGPRFNGVRWNKAAAAWELTRAALEEKQ